MIKNSVLEMIGNTPLVKLNKVTKGLNANIYAKVEKTNLSGSIKDRASLEMIKDMIIDGRLHEGDTIIEPTSGNTGIGLACLSNYFDLKCIIVMPSSMSMERRKLIKDFGAELVLVDGGMPQCIAKANELKNEIKGSVIIGQFDNESNVKAHYLYTGKEILNDLPDVDVVIAGIGTGGTITGLGKFFKEFKPSVEVIGVEPAESAFLTSGVPGKHKIQGIGAGFKPSILNLEYVDKVLTVKSEDAISAAKEVLKKESLFVGISSGATLSKALELAKLDEYKNKNIVVIMPDSGERYTWE